ncbi:MAG TPA: 4Fe-4S binding protein [Phycisphaerae bacterium]|nr:4Fe-4S binding protein [Phycisphaerae bacterium]
MRYCPLILAALFLTPSPAALGAERFALPQFKSGYEMPRIDVPPASSDTLQYLDVAALVVALALASYLALRTRSRRALWVLMAASLVYFGFYRGGCICTIGAIQNVALALADGGYAVPLVAVAFFLLPLAATLLFGRTFCAAVCPLGAIQDIVAIRPIRVPAWLDHGLGLLAYVYLGAAVLFAATGAAFLICEYDPFVAIFRLVPFTRPNAWMEAFGGSMGMLILGAAFLVAGLFIARPYCRWLCPYGALLRLLSRASKWHVTITPDECIQCTLCEDSCPFGAIAKPTTGAARPDRIIDRRRLALLLILVPVLLAAGGGFGWWLGDPFSRMHFTVQQAERVRLEETGRVEGTEDISDAFYKTQQPREELYAEADAIRDRFAVGGPLLGVWVGLVVAVKLIHLSVYRTRTDYEPDRAACLSCGRCFAYCPVERKRLKTLGGEPTTP